MGKLLSERDEQRLSRALPFIERMIRGPVSHSGETEVVVTRPCFGIRLTSNHPGKGTAFDVTVAKWDSSSHDFDYANGTTEKAIDLRAGATYPDGTVVNPVYGVAVRMPSDTYGSIYLIIDLDCE